MAIQRSRLDLYPALLCLFLAEAQARGQPVAHDVADEQFMAGVQAFQAGDNESAIQRFETAYRVSPHPSVLYNLGLAYEAAGRPVEALDAWSRYLERGGAGIGSVRRAEVRDAIELNRKRIGEVTLNIMPQAAEVVIDGRLLSPAMVAAPVPLVVGIHGVAVQAPGFVTEARSITIASGKRTELRVELSPTVSRTHQETSVLNLFCSVPDVTLQVDGGQTVRAASGSLVLPPGRHTVRFYREGYNPEDQDVVLEAGGSQQATCKLLIRPDLPADRAARLSIGCSVPHPSFTLDGAAYEGQLVPAGRHHLVVSCADCAPWSTDVNLAPGGTSWVYAEPALRPDALRREREARTRRTWAWIAGGTGIASGVASLALFALRGQQVAAWQEEGAKLSQQLSPGTPPSRALFDASLHHQQDSRVIQRTADAAIGTAVIGAITLATAALLYFGDSSRPEASAVAPPQSSRSSASNVPAR